MLNFWFSKWVAELLTSAIELGIFLAIICLIAFMNGRKK